MLPNQILFGPESDLNFEAGYKAQLLDGRVRVNADVFYTLRKSLQMKTSEQLDPSNPDDFTLYTGNADSGRNYGLETEIDWRAHLGGELSAPRSGSCRRNTMDSCRTACSCRIASLRTRLTGRAR